MLNKNKLSRKNKNRNLFDQTVREQNIDEWNGLLEFLDTGERVTEFKNNDQTTVRTGELRADNVFKTPKNYYLNVENSHACPTYDKIVKQTGYGFQIYDEPRRHDPNNSKWRYEKNYTQINSIYICGKPSKEKFIQVPIQISRSLIVWIFSINDVDGITYLNKLKNKIENKQPLNYSDVAFLKFSTLTHGNFKKHEMLLKAIRITKNDETLPKEIKLKIELVQQKVCEMYIDEKYQEEIIGELKMKTLKQELIDEVTEQVTEQVTKQNLQKTIEAFKQIGVSDEKINQAINLINQKNTNLEINTI